LEAEESKVLSYTEISRPVGARKSFYDTYIAELKQQEEFTTPTPLIHRGAMLHKLASTMPTSSCQFPTIPFLDPIQEPTI